MIGDWVQDLCPVVIDAVSNEDVCTYRTDNGYITANPSNLKPIQITPEILEKNGFTEKGYHYHISNDYYGLFISEVTDSIWKINYYNHESSAFDGCVCVAYIHELQHAIRLWRLTEIADNFKVE